MSHNPLEGQLHRAFTPQHHASLTRLGRTLLFILPVFLLIFTLAFWQYRSAYAAVSDITVTIYAAPNLVVDSNVLSPSTQAPEVATVIGRFCNTSGIDQTAVVAYIGDYNSGTPTSSTPGVYPSKTNVTIGTQLYSGTYRFTHLGGTADGTRLIGTIPAGQCRYQYWSFTYPKTANGGTIPAWGNDVKPQDDLFLDFDIWAAQGGTVCNVAACNKTHTAYMRNEISAMANKIEPNGNPGGSWFNTNAETVNVGETITTNGILYRLGRVNFGFDNNGDLNPDYNAWLQPIGNPTYDPSCFRLIEVSGVLTVTRSTGDVVIPFNHSLNQANDAPLLYFTDLPADNTDVNGLVYYTFMALGGPCAVPVSPYQEVASGDDNEKFNGDYGAGGPGKINSYTPNLTFDKSGPTSAAEATPFQYAITFQNTGGTSMGLSLSTGFAASFVVSDTVPNGLQYVINSASTSNTPPAGNSYVIYYSTNSGLTWTTTDPGTTLSSGPNSLVMIQWWLSNPLAAGASGTVRYQAQFPLGYGAGAGDRFVDNCADARLGTGTPLARDCATTGITGANTIGDTVFADDGTGGSIANNGIQGTGELGIGNITVNLYWDRDNDGVLDTTDPLINTVSSLPSYAVIDGRIDINASGGVTTADDGTLLGVNVIDGRLDMDGNGSITTADDGNFAGYTVIDGDLDMDAGGTITAADDGNLLGKYQFRNLPDARYIVVVDTADPQLPVGYGPTTARQFAVNLNDPGNLNYVLADFGFGPSLEINKYLLTSDPAYEGDTVTFRIDLTNKLPGDGTAAGNCRYTLWSTIAHPNSTLSPPGGNAAGAQWLTTSNALNAQDSTFATTVMNDNTDLLGLSGFNTNGQLGNITNVRFIAYTKETIDLKATDSFFVRVWYTTGGVGAGAAIGTYQYFGNGTFTAPATAGYFTNSVGTIYGISENITSLRAWTWADFASNITEMQVEGNKGGGGGTSGDIGLDAVAYIITTDQICGGEDTTITTLPHTDTYNSSHLQYVSATTAPTTQTPGTITWANVGPLYAGQTKSITVTFTALDPGATTVNTINTAAVTGALFGNGRPVNDDTDPANVQITPTGSISGRIWSDVATLGWQGTTGYAGADTFIPGVTLTLFGCYTSDPTTGGTLITDVFNGGRTCANQNAGAGWFAVKTTVTDANGAYSFTGLRMGYYYVNVTSGIPGGATQSAEPIYNGTGLTCGTANATCLGNWNTTGAATTVANTDLDNTNFNPIGVGDPLATPNEDIINVNFGYQNVPARIYGKVYSDENADGDQDSGEEALSGVQVRLCTDAACTVVIATQNTAADGSYSFTGFAVPANYFVVVTQPASTIQSDDPDNTGNCGGSCDNRTNTIAMVAGQISGSHDFGYHPYTAFNDIGDTLYVDWNGNGIQNSGEEGIANVTVYLYEDEDNDGVIDSGVDALIDTVTTNASGVYTFADLVNGNYIVVVNTSDPDFPSFSGTYSQTQDPDGACPGATCESTSTSAAIAGADDTDNDFGYQPTGTGSIGNYVWRDTDADGLQDTSESGINGVTVNLYQDQNGNGVIDGDDALVATTTTAGNGAYLFSNLPATNYIVSIPLAEFGTGQELNGTTMTTSGAAYTNNTTQVSYRKTLTSGEDFLAADFGFATGQIGDFIWRDNNGNGTPDTGEPGISGVTVSLWRDTNGNGLQDDGGSALATTTTNGSGIYNFTGLTAGNYVVVVSPPGGYTLTGDPDAYGIGPSYPLAPPCSTTGDYAFCDHQYGVELYAGEVDLTADFGYRPLGVIGDTLWIDGDGDNVRDTGEAGIPFVTVNLCSALPCTGGNILQTTTTDSDGYYSFGGLGNATYHVAVDTTDPDFLALGSITPTYDPDGTPNSIANTILMAGGVITSIGGNACTNCDLNVDFGYRYTGTNLIRGTIWHDDDSGGQTGGTGDIDGGETLRYGGVTVYLWYCTGACDSGSNEVLVGTTTTLSHNVIDGYIDVSGNGTIGPEDDGLLQGINVIDGQLDLNGSGTITTADDGTYVGITVIDGRLDMDNNASITTADDGSLAGRYQFPNLADGTYAVSYNPSSTGLTGLTTTTTYLYDNSPGTDPSVTFAGGNGTAVRDFGLRSNLDFGDLPASYNRTIVGDDGARHTLPVSGGVYLGDSRDSDADGQESTTAGGSLTDGDDGDGIDDEDGITRSFGWVDGTDGGIVDVEVVCPTGTCYLSAWIDWNGDGDFLDSGERVLLDEPVINGTQFVTFDIPAGTFPGAGPGLTFNARFRLYRSSTGGAAQPTGYTVNGEVEDYQFGFSPTAVTLRSTMTTLAQPALLATTLLLLLAALTTLLILRRHPNRRASW
jgi:hypothetical protein